MKALLLAAGLLLAAPAGAQFGVPGGEGVADVDRVAAILRQDAYDLELLISFGTSKGGSAGHLALAVRGDGPDDSVYSANFYADRAHGADFYTDALMVKVPKKEYLFGTASTIAATTQFGLDYGEIYKRAVVGVRVHGVPATEKDGLVAFFARLNDDYRNRASKTEYHDREVAYDYLRLNCAKTIGSAFRYGAGYSRLDIAGTKLLPGRTRLVAALNANIPTEMAMKLIAEWDRRGYGLDVVLYQKYPSSPYVDPHDEDQVAFKDLPNRFPSVLSRDFRKEQGRYQDYDNLFAMHLLYNLGKYNVRVNETTLRLEVEQKKPMAYAEAVERAVADARSDSGRGAAGYAHLYDFPR